MNKTVFTLTHRNGRSTSLSERDVREIEQALDSRLKNLPAGHPESSDSIYKLLLIFGVGVKGKSEKQK